MHDIKSGDISLIGYGVSNRALCNYFLGKGIYPTVRSPRECALPKGVGGIFGDGYLHTTEKTVFRSPGVRPDLIKGECEIYTEIGYALEKASSFKIGVTGSDGKTTTSTLIYRMLMEGGKNAFLGGNVGSPLIGIAEKVCRSDYVVVELSSFQLFDCAPSLDIAAVTNITENHLDWHKDMDEYISAKKNILKNAKRAVLNYDDPTVRGFGCEKTTYFSLQDCTAKLNSSFDFVHIVNGQVCYNERTLFPVSEVCLHGEFNVQNVLCAIGCVYPIVGDYPIYRVAREFCGVDNRMQTVDTVNGVAFVDSAIDSTPSRTVKTLSAFPLNRVACILGGYDKNLSYECLGSTLDKVKTVVLCGENKDKISACVKRHTIKVNTLKEAVLAAYKSANHGDFVILSPASASFDMFKNYKEKANCFKELVRGLKNGEY